MARSRYRCHRGRSRRPLARSASFRHPPPSLGIATTRMRSASGLPTHTAGGGGGAARSAHIHPGFDERVIHVTDGDAGETARTTSIRPFDARGGVFFHTLPTVAFGGNRFGTTRHAIDKPSVLFLRRRHFTMLEPVNMPTALQKLPLRYSNDLEPRSVKKNLRERNMQRREMFCAHVSPDQTQQKSSTFLVF